MKSPKANGASTPSRIMATLKRLRTRRARTVALAPSALVDRQQRREELLASLDGLIARYDKLLKEIAASKPKPGRTGGKSVTRTR